MYIKHRVAGKRSYGLCSQTAAVAAVQQWYLDQFDGRSNVSRGHKTAGNIVMTLTNDLAELPQQQMCSA
jgi:hypothetical protein